MEIIPLPGGYNFGCVCLSVCVGDYFKSNERIFLIFLRVKPDQRKK